MTPPRSSVVTVLFILLTTVSSRALQSGPTAQECRHHIDAAIKDFLDGQQDRTDPGAATSEAYTRAQLEDGYDPGHGAVGSEDGLTSIPEDQQETEDETDQDELTNEQSEIDQSHGDEDDDSSEETQKERSVTAADDDDDDDDNDDEQDAADGKTSDIQQEVPETSPEESDDDDEDDDDDDQNKTAEAKDDDDIDDKIVDIKREIDDEDDDDDIDDRNVDIKREIGDEDDDDDEEDVTGEERPEDQVEAPPTGHKDQFPGKADSARQESPVDEESDSYVAPDDDGIEQDDDQNDKDEDRVKRSVADSNATDDDDDEEDSDLAERHARTTDTQADSDDEPTATGQSTAEPEGGEETPGEQDEEAQDNGEEEEEEEVVVAGPGELRTRDNIEAILGVGEDQEQDNAQQDKIGNDVLKEIKRLYEGAVRPLEQLYKFKDISTRQMGDAEIFSRPMVLFMGPWSTGKSAIINYLLGTEYSRHALKTGAEPTSGSFTVITYGETDQVIEGTQLAADWAFSTLQKFGQTFLDHLRGRKMPNPLLQKMTIVDTPGILENRKSTERQYPFNDAFQWFIDRADLIYIVFDPTKLDIGQELEALFDQLKGREGQVRILLNKADTVKPQELMKVQGTLLWNLSPLIGTSEAPTVFVGSLWSRPYLPGSPTTLLDAQEEAFLEDVREALERRIEHKVAQARRHAVRVRNHAKMVDCYLSTYYNHKSFFSNKRKVADDIVDNPQHYHIYEGLSTLTNVSRYDLPDPDIYRDFFRIHPLFDFKPLASTCSYFKGCPLDKLDIAIAYDLPELVGKYHRMIGNRPVVGGR